MPYNLVGDDHFQTHGPTILGMKALRECVTEHEQDFPALAQFVTHGHITTKKDQFIRECGMLAQRDIPSYVKTTLANLRSAALKSGSFLALVQ